MESLTIEPTANTFSVKFGAETGLLDLRGRSTPENAVEFFEPIEAWVDRYVLTPKPNTSINISIEYINSASSRYMVDIFKKFESIHRSGKSAVKISWEHDPWDETIIEMGEEYQELVNCPFELVAIED